MNIEQQIEFDKIKEIWMNLAVTAHAKERIKETSFYLSELELRKQLRDTTDARLLMEKMGNPPLQSVDEIKDILTAAEKGDCLTPYQLERVEAVLAAIRRLKDYLERGKLYDNPLSFYKVIDTHLGSGSSRIAAYDMNLDFTGFEIVKETFDLQEERFAEYTAQCRIY